MRHGGKQNIVLFDLMIAMARLAQAGAFPVLKNCLPSIIIPELSPLAKS